jgi:phospholipase C
VNITLKKSATLIAAAIGTLSGAATAASVTPTTPIKHLIVVVGENVSFDALFATYAPKKGQRVHNLLSQGIVDTDGNPGPHYHKAVQRQAVNESFSYTLKPRKSDVYDQLPQPTLIGVYDPVTLTPYGGTPDPRFAGLDVSGPFQITKYVPYGSPNSATGDPAHRFFQMWQQSGGTNRDLSLYAWVAVTTGTGGATDGITAANPGQGGELMGFFNMSQGDAPYFRSLAEQFTISDNYHQPIMGGTGANFFALATGDTAVYKLNGQLAVPPANQIENPDVTPRTENFYLNDGYSGGSYVNCSDAEQPGVAAILAVVKHHARHSNCEQGAYYLVNNYDPPYTIDGQPKALGEDKYVYPPQDVPTIGELLSAHNVSWRWYTGGRDESDVTGDALYAQLYNYVIYPQVFAAVKAQFPAGTPDSVIATYAAPAAKATALKTVTPLLYNNIGDPENASANVVNGPLKGNLKGLATFYADVATGTLPAVSYVVPKNLDSGHPGYSVVGKYELFLADLVAKVQANPALWADTAILITTDEGGGYFDSGYIQNLDFFGDGPRIPLIAVSPYAKKGHVDHTYHDHASILKFIERNWRLPTLSSRSRDNLPNPKHEEGNPYVPQNRGIGDLMGLFDFPRKQQEQDR